MSTKSCGWPLSVRAALACMLVRLFFCGVAGGITHAAFGAQPHSPAQPSEAVPSQLLSDDERIDFCTQMHHASTPEQRRAVAARLHDTLTPRAQVQGVDLPAWVKEGQPEGSGRLPGLSCDGGAHARTTGPARIPDTVPHKPTTRETVEAKPLPSREVTTHAAPSPAQIPVRETTVQTTATVPPAPAVPDTDATPPSRTSSAGDIPVEQDHGVAYVTGGVGQDEATAMRGLATGYNMRATFTTRSGEYLSGVNVQVLRADGSTAFAATTDGPYLFARLPQGHYRVIASLDGAERSRDLYVPAHGGVRFSLVWPPLR